MKEKEVSCRISEEEIDWFISKKREMRLFKKDFIIKLFSTCKNLYLSERYLENRNKKLNKLVNDLDRKLDHISRVGKMVVRKLKENEK